MVSAFIEEKLKGQSASIPLSSVCNSNCLFCSNHQNPFKIKRVGHLSFEDFKKQVFLTKYFQYGFNHEVGLSDVLPGTISEGEAMLNPEFKNMVQYLKKTLGQQINIKVTTNGGLLDDEMIDFLSQNLPFEISVSIPSFNKEHWLKMFGISNESLYQNAINSFSKMISKGISVKASIVTLPSLTSFEDLEYTIKTLIESKVPEIVIWYPGYTKYTPNAEFLEHVKNVPFSDIHSFIVSMKMKYRCNIWEMIPDGKYNNLFLPNSKSIRNIAELAFKNNAKKILWFTSDAAFDSIKQLIESDMEQYPFIINKIKPIKNVMYGGNISCSGLITVGDILLAVEEHLESDVDLVIFPPALYLNKLGEDITGDSFFKVEEKLESIPYLFA